MPRASPFTIELFPAEEQELRRRAAKNTLPYCLSLGGSKPSSLGDGFSARGAG